jgi:hypothetical protein
MPVGASSRDRGAMGDVGKLTGASNESSFAKIHSTTRRRATATTFAR